MRRLWWVGALAIFLLGVGVIGAMAYASHNTPGRLTLGDHPPTAGQPSPMPPSSELADACGEGSFARPAVEWAIQPGSQAGFRAHENFLQWQFPHEAVARSNAVAGFLVGGADRRNLRSACVAVDLRSLKSVDKLPPPLPPASDRDQLFQEMLGLGEHPIAVFTTQQLRLPAAENGQTFHLEFAGDITIRSTTKPVKVSADCRLDSAELSCAGVTRIDASEFDVPVPDGPIQVDPTITIEFSLFFA
ncbi:MAG: YceI family protein [Chloroflexi bacterium]|nr:MAG: YceI family protein [Chloroflexota bacterium]